MWLVAHPRLYALTIGICIGIPFVYPMTVPIAYLGFFLLWRLIYSVSQSTLPLLLSLVFGVKALMSLSWFWSTLPITWLPQLAYPTQVIAAFFYWSTSALWLASTGVVLAVLVAVLRRWGSAPLTFGLPVAVVLAEYLGAVLFSLMTIGPGGSIGGGFSFGHSGYLFSWLYPFAIWGGVYAVGVFGLLGISLLHRWYESKKIQSVAIAFCTIIGLFAYSFSILSASGIPATIALVQTDSLPRERISNLEPLVTAALATGADYVLLPEDSRYFTEGYQVPTIGPVDAVDAWRIFNPTSTAMVIDSGRTTLASGAVVQRAYLWDESSLYAADKAYLVPQGEYMPSLYAWALRVLGLGLVADALSATINYVPGTMMIAKEAPSYVPQILFCFESVSPLAAKRLMTTRPSDFIVHPMSHSWFHTPTVLWPQLETMLRFQAVYAGVPIISVGNDVRGSAYLPNGTMLAPETIASFAEGTVDIMRPTQSPN